MRLSNLKENKTLISSQSLIEYLMENDPII